MWLPKDERKMLAFYFRKIGKVDEQEVFSEFTDSKHFNDDMKALGWNENRENRDGCDKLYIDRVRNADDMLKKRGLINVSVGELSARNVSLTMKGCDLGRKYCSKLDTFYIWCNEYKLWIILSVIIGFITLVVYIIAVIFKE